MEKQTKNIITRDFIEKELRSHNKADIRSTLVLCGAMSLIFLPLTVGIVCGILSLLQAAWLEILLSVLITVFTSAPVWIYLLSLRIRLKERKFLQNGDFDIVTCKVQYKEINTVNRRTVKYLHFVGFKKIAVTNVNYDLTSHGDEFYIVYYKGLTDIKLFYSLKMYELKEK